ncbi:acetolactate synthase large subunit [Leifsonia poae]|uniref:acetolactate synthase large subunit n=1 Tax=Leifsonia poae TaxID=110933 RepID=UPI0021D94DAC|nr:acetolactate synthase large subunit [Leifsonia poae]
MTPEHPHTPPELPHTPSTTATPPALPPSTVEMTGAVAVLRTLARLGVTDIFGIPGSAVIPIYDALPAQDRIRHILVRHEQDAGHAAEGYAAATGRVGVAIATSGPGATNLVTAIADAFLDSVPLLVITGQVFSELMGTDAFQEADIVGITLPITKHSMLVTRTEDIPSAIAGAYEIAGTGRPGPVLVDITKDAQQGTAVHAWPPVVNLPGYRPPAKTHRPKARQAARLLADAERPVLYVGGGVIRARASAALRRLAELTGAPVVTTLTARGAFPDSHPHHLGMPGMHGSVPAVLGLQESDLIIALGARFDDRVTGDPAAFAPGARVVHIDIDPAEISKIRHADVPIVGDLAAVIPALTEEVEANLAAGDSPDLTSWWVRLDRLRADYPLGFEPTSDGLLSPQHIIRRVAELTGPEAVYVTGVGQHQMWAAQFIPFERPRSFLTSGGAGTMGYAVPAAMGAKLGEPDRVVWAIDGDGCFQMTNRELATCLLEHIPIKVALINNSSLGMIRQWQNLFYDGRYSQSELNTGHGSEHIPDFVRMAEAYGAHGERVTRAEEVDDAIRRALTIDDRPVVIDFVVSADALVWPMVPQGVGNDRIRYAQDRSPAWGGE